MTQPQLGDEIYVHSSLYISHGSDDFCGGLCTIDRIEYSKTLPPHHRNYCMVGIAERPGWLYNYLYLLEEQDKLRGQFGDQRGHPDPDIDTPWLEEGDFVNGEVYHGPPVW